MSSGPDLQDATEVVHLDVPAMSSRLRLVRLAVVGLATDYGADVDELEDVRIATGEICSHLVNRAGPADRLLVDVSVAGGAGAEGVVIGVRATVGGLPDPGPLDELSDMILGTTSTGHGVQVDADGVTAWFRRTLPAAGISISSEGGHAHDG